MQKRVLVPVALAAFIVSGCGEHYVTPGGGAPLALFDGEGAGSSTSYAGGGDLFSVYSAEPASAFPANLAIVRVQDRGYSTHTNHGYGHGRYSVVTTRDIETEDALQKIESLPMVLDVVPIGRVLVPSQANTIRDLRAPAAQLRADMLLIYTVDTTFSVDGRTLGPLTLISLGLLPTTRARVVSTVAGALVDVRTGFVYGTAEETAIEEQKTSIWSTPLTIDSARLTAEGNAFNGFVDEFQGLWAGVVNTHARTAPRTSSAPAGNGRSVAERRRGYYRVDLRTVDAPAQPDPR